MSFRKRHFRYIEVAVLSLSLSLSLSLALALPAFAEKIHSPACPPHPIILGLYEFGDFYRAGEGFDKDIALALAERSGCRFDLRVMQRVRIWQDMQGGSVDMTLSAAATPERILFSWAVPYLWVRNMVILNKEVPLNINSTADFIATPYLRLGVARGYIPGHPYDEFVSRLRNIGRVDDVEETERLYAMFKHGRFQAILASRLVYSSYLKDEIAANNIRVADWSLGKPMDSANLLLSKKSFTQEEAASWAELMRSMNSDGTLLRLLSKYVDHDAAVKMLSPDSR